MVISSMLIVLAFAVITALGGGLIQSVFKNQEMLIDKLQTLIEQGESRSNNEEKISKKLEYFAKTFKHNGILTSCELPVDKNVISTVIGLKLYKNPKYIQKHFYANFRCADPGTILLSYGPANVQCNGKSEEIAGKRCVHLKNETEWQVDMLQLNSDRRQCLNGFYSNINKSMLFENPFSPDDYFQCLNNNTLDNNDIGYEFVTKSCIFNSVNYYFDKSLKSCKQGYSMTAIHEYKPSIIVNASDSALDSMGWLLVERGSNVTMDCVYPKVTDKIRVTWFKTDYETTFFHNAVQISSQWISDYRNRIVLSEVDFIDTGFYACQVIYTEGVKTSSYHNTNTRSHGVTIALKEKECPETPLPDFKLHHKYYIKYPVMNRVKRWCQRN